MLDIKDKQVQIRVLATILWLAAVTCLCVLIWDLNTKNVLSSPPFQVGRLFDDQNDIEVLASNSNYWQGLPGGSNLHMGDVIYNSGKTVGSLRLRDGRQIKIWPGGILHFDLFRSSNNQPRFRLTLKTGRLHATAWHLGVKEVDIFANQDSFLLKSGSDYLDLEVLSDNRNKIHLYRNDGVIRR